MREFDIPKTEMELEELIGRNIGVIIGSVTLHDEFTIQSYRGIIKRDHSYYRLKGFEPVGKLEPVGDHEFIRQAQELDKEKKVYYPTKDILCLQVQRGKMEFNEKGIYVPSLALIFYNVESYTLGKVGYSPLITLLQHNKLWQEPRRLQ